MMRITRHFVTVGRRRVHYLRAGTGPALVVLHASACSSKVVRPLVELFSTRFTVIAPDNPGFGLSDKLDVAQPGIDDLADAVAEMLDALGIAQAALYGRHTGASIAVEFAARHPARCAMALTDGYAILSGDYDEEKIRRYLVPIEPKWDGSHLVWLWFRYRDQHTFWPWNAQTIESRADTDIPDLDFLHRGVVEFLEAGNDYRLGYAAPFRHDALGVFDRLKVPVCFGNRPGDWMLKMLPLYPKSAWTEVMPRDATEAAARELAILATHPATGEPPLAPPTAPVAGRSTTDYVDLGTRQVLVRSYGNVTDATVPVLVLHHAPGSSALYEPLLAEIARWHPVLAIDLPGHGESDPLPDRSQSVEGWADTALATLDALRIGAVHLYGHNGGAAVAVEIALRSPARAKTITLDAPVCLDRDTREQLATTYAPDARPTWEGAHLLRVFHHLRDQELWWPWFSRRQPAIRKTPPRIDPAALTERVREAVKQPASYAPAWQAIFRYPFRERLAQTTGSLRVIAADADVFAHCAQAAQALRPGPALERVDDTPAARAAALRVHVEGARP